MSIATADPQSLETQIEEAWAAFGRGRTLEAQAKLRQLVAGAPSAKVCWHLLAATSWRSETWFAEKCLLRTLTIDPGDVTALNALAATLKTSGRSIEGLALLRVAMALQPGAPTTIVNLSSLSGGVSLAWCRRALIFDSGNVDIILELHARLLIAGQLAEAAALLDAREGVLDPRIQAARICTSFLMDDAGPNVSLRLARSFDERFARLQPPVDRPVRTKRLRSRKLRIGYVEGDSFRLHTAAFTLLPVIEAHDRDSVEVFCYSDVPVSRRDAITDRFVELSKAFRHLDGVDDASFAAVVAEDEIDVVIDSLGYAAGSRLLALARRPAPLQVGWPPMGSLGLDAIEYVLADRWIVPFGAEHGFSEKVVRLPIGLVYDPLIATPALTPAPERELVFGSFNQLAKLSPRTKRLWGRILQAVPRSRLLLKAPGLANREMAGEVLAAFAREGIGPDRIDLRPPTRGFEEHMASYAAIDIALDPMPYGGVITTLEAMWMGVPVVTLAGDRILGRYGYSFVNAIGAVELAALDEDEYVAKAIVLANDEAGRAALRQSLRPRMKSSPLGDARAMTASLEAALRGMIDS